MFATSLGGDRVRAAALLERLDALGPHPARIFEGTVYRARAWLARIDGLPETAAEQLRQGAIVSHRAGNLVAELACWQDLARMGRTQEAACGAAWLLAERARPPAMEGALLPAQLAHIAALVSGRSADLVACSERLARLGTMQWAAEAMEAAAVAASREGDGHGGRAVPTLLARAAQLRAAMGELPSRMRAAVRMPLTRRERDVAVLAAQGASSREIGGKLYVSARTVESHLARIYGKLGIHGRAELAQMIHANGEVLGTSVVV